MFRSCHIIIFLCLSFCCCSIAKAEDKDTLLNVAYIENYIYLKPLMEGNIIANDIGIDDISKTVTKHYPALPQLAYTNFHERRFYRFSITNTSRHHSDTVLFYSGLMIEADVYETDSTGHPYQLITKRVKISAAPISSSFECIPLSAPTGSVKHFIVVPKINYYNWFNWKPFVVRKVSVNDLVFDHIIKPHFNYLVISLILMGMMLIMFGYPAIKFFYTGKKEYFFNAVYVACFVAYFGYFLVLDFSFNTTLHKGLNFVPHLLQMLGHIAQLYFAFYFLDVKRKQPVFYKVAQFMIFVLIAFVVADSFVAFSTAYSRVSEYMFIIIRIVLLFFVVYAIIVLLRWKFYLAEILAWGMIVFACFALTAMLYSTILTQPAWLKFIGGPLNLFFVGILIELFFFRLALGRKELEEEKEKLKAIQALQLDNERKELEKSLAIVRSQEEERNRIAKEIHDDIGSGLTSIRLTSEIALAKNENQVELERISATADELISNLNEIVWSINSKNDSVPNMLAYIRRYVVNFFESSAMQVQVSINEDLPDILITGEDRRNIFMAIKECLTNIVKHSNANTIIFTASVINNLLIVSIADDGIGFDQNTIQPYKNGVRNIAERMEVIGGKVIFETGNGTTVILQYPITTK